MKKIKKLLSFFYCPPRAVLPELLVSREKNGKMFPRRNGPKQQAHFGRENNQKQRKTDKMLTKASVELIQSVQQSPKDFFSGEQLTLEFEGGKVLHLRFHNGDCYIGIAGCCTGEARMKRGEEIAVGPMGTNILDRPLIQLKRALARS